MEDGFFDDAPILEMLDDDSLQQLWRNSTIPDPLRINDDDRPARTYAETRSFTTLDSARPEKQILALEKRCELRVQSASAALGRAETPCTHENVVGIRFHLRSAAGDVGQSSGIRFVTHDLVIAGRGDVQVIRHNSPTEEMLGDDAPGAVFVDTRIPDVFRVDDDHRPVTALVHTTRMVHADGVADACGGHFPLERRVYRGRIRQRARFPACADKYVMTVLAHSVR